MRSRFAVTLLLLGALAPAAQADRLHLRWNACSADGGVMNRSFACTTNSGADVLVGSFDLSAPVPGVVGASLTVDMASATVFFPAWWEFFGAGPCRPLGASFNTTISTSAVSCADWSAGLAFGAVTSFISGVESLVVPGAVNTARLQAAIALPPGASADLGAGPEYFLFNLVLSHQKSTGPGSCDGCSVPLCIGFKRVAFTTLVPADQRVIGSRGQRDMEQLATWQGGAGIVVSHPGSDFIDCPNATPVRRSNWGAIKSLYR